MTKLHVKVRTIKLIDIERQQIDEEKATRIKMFADKNSYLRVVDISRHDTEYTRLELDRRDIGGPFIVIIKEDGCYYAHGMLRGLHADDFLKEFCNEQGND
mgnify:CR=1 FL=1